MNDDIYIEIIKHSGVNQYKTLKQVNKTFKYYTEKTEKYLIRKFLKKYLKDIRCNLMCNRQQPLLLLRNFGYNFDLNCDISKTKLVSQLVENHVIIHDDNIFSTIVYNKGDILQSFTICGKNIKKVELYTGETLIWKSWYFDANLINIKPFFNGILMFMTAFHEIKIKIYAEKCNNVYLYFKFLKSEIIREMITSPITVPYIFYNNGILYRIITYRNGILSLEN